MKSISFKIALYCLVVISAIVWLLLAYFKGVRLAASFELFMLLPTVVTIDLFIISIFVGWGWKFKLFKGWLVKVPNLNGTWIGMLQSNWINPETGETISSIPIMLTIKQNISRIHCRMVTKEMESSSFSEGFNIIEEKQLKQLTYIYGSKPRLKFNDRSIPHDGVVVLDILEGDSLKLKGKYWTERNTSGELSLVLYAKEILHELPDSFNYHPVSDGIKRNIS